VAGLVGVVVGGVLNSALASVAEGRRQRLAGGIAARLVSSELELLGDTIAASIQAGRWGAILDPGLPYSRGLWAVEHRGGERDNSAWPAMRADLAAILSPDEWDAVSRPYELVDKIALKFWTDLPDRELGEARTYLEEVVRSVGPAREALQAVDRRRRHVQPRRQLASSSRASG
jgi:hypothetical protein